MSDSHVAVSTSVLYTRNVSWQREGAVHLNTIATAIPGVAINKLLLAERHKVVCATSPRSFMRTCDGKRQTRNALSLILHENHHTLRRPINR